MGGAEPSPCAQGERRPPLGSDENSSQAQGPDSKSSVLLAPDCWKGNAEREASPYPDAKSVPCY